MYKPMRKECSIEIDDRGIVSVTKDDKHLFDVILTLEDKKKIFG